MDVNSRGATIVAASLSEAWAAAFDALMQPGIDAIEPLVVTVNVFDTDNRPQDIPAVVSLVNAELQEMHKSRTLGATRRRQSDHATIEATASTIFPESLWNPERSRDELYARYLRLLPRLRRDARNRRGTYFQRLIAYGRGPNDGNQLEHMLLAFENGVKRTSAFQATISDPKTDLTMTPMLGFPCLQQVAVHPKEPTGTLSITGFYGTQYLFERGYGNFLGLCRLGRFLATEMRLRLTRMTCIASYVPMEQLGKTRGRELLEEVQSIISQHRAVNAAAKTDSIIGAATYA